jgi:EmrB/QacA subfamily drug resistance transporter
MSGSDEASRTLSTRGRTVVLVTCCLSVFVAGLDVTIVNVALPSIQRALNAPVSGLQWAIDAYTLVIACLLMLSGSLADRFGRRRVFQTGLALFSLGSLLCSVAPTLGALVAFRALQAVGGSMLNPVAMSIIATTFTEPAARARAVGAWGAVAGLSLAGGPVLGGLLVSGLGWRAIFWINLPVGALAIYLTHRFVPESRAGRGKRFDPLGQLLVVTLLGPATAAVIEGPGHGWGSPLIIALFALALVSAFALVLVERRQAEPLVDMRFFRSPAFSGAALICVVALMTLGGFLLLNTLYLQDVRGYSPLRAGVLTIPMAATLAVLSLVSGRIVAVRGPRPALVLAGLLLAAGTGVLIGTGLTPATGISCPPTSFMERARAWSAPRSRTPRCRGSRATKRASPERSPRPAVRPARRSAWRYAVRSLRAARPDSSRPVAPRGPCSPAAAARPCCSV